MRDDGYLTPWNGIVKRRSAPHTLEKVMSTKAKFLRRLLPLALIVIVAVGTLAAAGPGYKVVNTYMIGGDGGWDYLLADASARRLYISRATHVIVLDLDSGKNVGDIPNTSGVHGIALAPDLNRGFTSNGRENTVTVFDMKTLAVSNKIKVGENPDAILYDPATKRVFTFNGKSQDATAIDAEKGTVLGTIKLDGKPEFAASDGKANWSRLIPTNCKPKPSGRWRRANHPPVSRWTRRIAASSWAATIR
jgi:YVTN family beta-propeller protein